MRERVGNNELIWVNYFALPITEEAEEEPILHGKPVDRRNNEWNIENVQHEKESYNDIRVCAHTSWKAFSN